MRELFYQFLRTTFLGCVILLWLPQPSKASDIYGFVIGIDDYVGIDNDLAGAVNDADDISRALGKVGAKKIIRFINHEATKANIEQAWFSLVDEAKPGDTIIFTFSGHGSQEDEPPGRNGEKDGKNENFLLAGFQHTGPATRERIVDDELFVWTKMADDKGIKVILVADSCHSGTMNRSVGNSKIRYRQGRFRNIIGDQLQYPSSQYAHITQHELKNVTYIGATSDDRLTPEIVIDGQVRGALSWSFARALDGFADEDGDGVVSQFELLRFLIPAVRAHVENQQLPHISPLRAATAPLFPVAALATASTGVQPNGVADQQSVTRSFNLLRVAVKNGDAKIITDIDGIRIVKDTKKADLIWEVDKKIVRHSVGGVVAENVDTKSIRPILVKWSALKYLKSKMVANPVKMELPLGNHRYGKLELVEVKVSGIRYQYLTLFNLPPDGKVEFFEPSQKTKNSKTKDWRNKSYHRKFRVTHPPYGAEHLVAIFSKKPLKNLHLALAQMKKPENAGALRKVLEEALANQDYQVGVLGVYTGK